MTAKQRKRNAKKRRHQRIPPTYRPTPAPVVEVRRPFWRRVLRFG